MQGPKVGSILNFYLIDIIGLCNGSVSFPFISGDLCLPTDVVDKDCSDFTEKCSMRLAYMRLTF
ncbi:hypothetical protein G3I01_11765 [Gramella sp. MT6]|nr:hypothetical protein G3I01_11765 [Gramella sp. MT6]